MAFQPNDNMISTDDWQKIRFSGICHLEINNFSNSGAGLLISTSSSGVPAYTIAAGVPRVWDITNSDDFSELYYKSAQTGNPAEFQIAGF